MATERLALPPELLGNVERYAVYRCYSDGGELLYVGESGELGKRLAAHAQKAWFVRVRGITLEWYADELDALNAERRAIHVEQPKYNILGRSAPPAQKPGSKPRRRVPTQQRHTWTDDELLAETRRQWAEHADMGVGLTVRRLELALKASQRGGAGRQRVVDALKVVRAEAKPRASKATATRAAVG